MFSKKAKVLQKGNLKIYIPRVDVKKVNTQTKLIIDLSQRAKKANLSQGDKNTKVLFSK